MVVNEAEGVELAVSIFVGTEDNCTTLHTVADLLGHFQASDMDMPLKAFVVPLPTDPNVAATLRKALIHSVNALFKRYSTSPGDMN